MKDYNRFINKKKLIIILIIINIPTLLLTKRLRKLNPQNQISIIINCSGDQYILNDESIEGYYFDDIPTQIYVNGILQDYNGKIAYDLKGKENNITMIWDHLLTNCALMFYKLINITKIDFSNFDSSKVENMWGMFFGCSSLISLNLNNFDTSSVKKMDAMFIYCSSLKSLDLSNFNTSSVTSMVNMFYGCYSLISLNLSNFDTSSVTEMYYMFYNCRALKTLNISSFVTSKVNDMMGLFGFCCSLTSLDLYNFDTSSVTSMMSMFNGCNSLISLNINNFNTSSLLDAQFMFYKCDSLISLDLNNFVIPNNSITKFFSNTSNNLIFCIDEEKNQEIISFLKLQNSNYYNNCSDICFNKTIKVKITENKKCSFDCINDDIYKFQYNNLCYKSCPNHTHNSTNNNYICIDDDIDYESYKIIENNKCSVTCSPINFLNNICKINNNNIECKDDMINNIRNALSNGSFDSLISDIILNKTEDLIAKENDIIYQITSSDNQNKIKYKNISTVKLGACEKKLRKVYNISEKDPLIIFKFEYFEEGLLIPIIEYEVYNIKEKVRLNLNNCKDEKILISIPVNIDEENLFKYNTSSEYYNDICFPYTTKYNTDIILSDRRNEFKNNNMSLCESNCEYIGYDINDKKALCECGVKIELPLISEIVINKDKLLNNFIDLKKTTNIFTIKCIDLLFSKEGLINNIGSYIILSIIILNTILVIIFILKGFNILYNKINEYVKIILKNKIEIEKEKNNIDKKEKNKNNKNEKDKKKNTKIEIYKIKNKNKNNPPKNNIKNKKQNLKINIKVKNINYNIYGKNSRMKLKKNMNSIDSKINFKNSLLNIKKIKNNHVIKYNDYELNNLKYKDAIKKDKRKFFEYYISLLKRRQIIIFTFYINDDYNSRIIKISYFLFSFSVIYVINALFFKDSTMHEIYEEKGSYNYIYQIPKVLYSTAISGIINFSFKYLSLSEKYVIQLREEEKKNIKNKFQKLIKTLIIKFIIFYILSFIFLIFFWFYLSSFCAVYKNTQVFLIKDTLAGFGLSLLYPFGICLLPGIFRIPSLNTQKKDKKMYL